MEKKLFRLFDFQKFEDNRNLRQIVDEVHNQSQARALSLEEMEFVNAAGEPTAPVKPEEKDR